MLQLLRIQNLALLESVELEFSEGFTCVTGETGAGKSVLLGALALLAGGRADKTIIRQGAESCELQAALHFPRAGAVDQALAQLGLPACEEGQLVLRRSLHREKPQRITVNGQLATLANLQRLGDLWVDFHGPAEPRRLLRPECQLELLDLFAAAPAPAEAFAAAYGAWRAKLREIEELVGQERWSEEQQAYAREQLAAIDRLRPSEEEMQQLERDFRRVQRGQELAALIGQLAAGFAGDKGLPGRLAPLVRAARQLAEADAEGAEIARRVEDLAREVADLGQECESLGSDLQFDPADARRIEERMSLWLEVTRKHGPDVAAVLCARETLARRLAAQGNIEGVLERLREEERALHQEAKERAAALSQAREAAGRRLSARLGPVSAGLGFRQAEFQVRLLPEPELGPKGDSRVEFLFSPNPGEPPLPLQKIASSGELARVMLALKSILAEVDATPVLVFDEVDANVGGEIGRVVGERLAQVARGHQVLCVTHLPQVAAQGRSHLVVEKSVAAGRTVISIRPIHSSRPERLRELARMLGDRDSRSALGHAEALLGSGQA